MRRIISLFVFVAVVWAPAAAFAAMKPVGKAASVQGSVTLQRGGKNYKLTQGLALYNGDTLVTGRDSFAKLLMVDDSLLTVGARSNFRIENFQADANTRSGSFRLYFGKMRAIVSKFAAGKSDVRFNTPTAVAGVRGTHLVVEFDAALKKTVVSVLEGSVAFRALDQTGEVLLGSRQRSEQQQGGSVAKPTVISQEQMQELDGEIQSQTPESPSQESGEQNGDGAKPAGDAAPGSKSSDPESGGDSQEGDGQGEQSSGTQDGRVEDNLNRVEQNLQQERSPIDENNPAENPASDTGVRVRW